MITNFYINEEIGVVDVFLEATAFHRDSKKNFIVDKFRYYYDGIPNDEIEDYIQLNYSNICKLMSDNSDFEVLTDEYD